MQAFRGLGIVQRFPHRLLRRRNPVFALHIHKKTARYPFVNRSGQRSDRTRAGQGPRVLPGPGSAVKVANSRMPGTTGDPTAPRIPIDT